MVQPLAAARSSTVHYLQHLLGCCLLSRNSLADHEEAPACQGMAAVQMQEDPHSDDDLVTTAHEMRLAVFCHYPAAGRQVHCSDPADMQTHRSCPRTNGWTVQVVVVRDYVRVACRMAGAEVGNSLHHCRAHRVHPASDRPWESSLVDEAASVVLVGLVGSCSADSSEALRKISASYR